MITGTTPMAANTSEALVDVGDSHEDFDGEWIETRYCDCGELLIGDERCQSCTAAVVLRPLTALAAQRPQHHKTTRTTSSRRELTVLTA